ncbi:DHHW family protein [Cohnella sp. GCM10027633]|uniref:DHHW family protein n=1 Tax=unclassified Cohnella TaxID=2636738 RepID=UPI00363D7228
MSARSDKLLVVGFVSVLFAASALFFLSPKLPFSETENRYLQKFPKLSWEGVFSKEVPQQLEDYVIDHFPYRDRWVWAKSATEQLRLKQDNNGIYKGQGGYLFERYDEPDDAKLDAYTEAIKRFALAHPEADVKFLLAPTSVGVYPELLPWKAPSGSQKETIASVGNRFHGEVSFLNGYDVLLPHKNEDIYYRTDHHWTTRGAYLAYEAYARSMRWEPMPESDFDIEAVSDSFLGSFHSKSQFAGSRPDAIEVYTPKRQGRLTMYVADTNETHTSLYAPDYLNKKDKYSYFMGGVHALTIIKSDSSPEDKKPDKLLVLKDSYAHSFIPFLVGHVSEIHVIDLRYYNGPIGSYMEQNGIKDVLMLYNAATFVQMGADMLKLK